MSPAVGADIDRGRSFTDTSEGARKDRQVSSTEGPACQRRGLPVPPEVGLVLVQHAVPVSPLTVVVAIDVGKNEFAVSVTTGARRRLLKPRLGCPMTAPSVREVVGRISRLLPTGAVVKVGIEAAGHYHLPLL